MWKDVSFQISVQGQFPSQCAGSVSGQWGFRAAQGGLWETQQDPGWAEGEELPVLS